MKGICILLSLLLTFPNYSAFSLNFKPKSISASRLFNSKDVPKPISESTKSGYKTFVITSSFATALSFLNSRKAVASLSETMLLAASNDDNIVVLGSGGKTGKLIVESLSKRGIRVKPTSRSGSQLYSSLGIETVSADVTRIETLESALSGASAVIFAASASSKGGSAQQVDYVGVENVAKECVRLGIPKLVVISSGAITRPNSLGFKITNLFGRIMEAKLKGEESLKAVYKAAPSGVTYAIIRPGGLGDGAPAGPSSVELNQGDAISGEISRSDVAECAIAAATSKKIPQNVTFEIYSKQGAGPLEGSLPQPTGYERTGDSYDKLFEGLVSGEVIVEPKK